MTLTPPVLAPKARAASGPAALPVHLACVLAALHPTQTRGKRLMWHCAFIAVTVTVGIVFDFPELLGSTVTLIQEFTDWKMNF
jgi:hypothetical protein